MVEETRVVEVYCPADDSVGSGYLVTPALVLTARHVVGASLSRAGPLSPPGESTTLLSLTANSGEHAICRVRSLGAPSGASFRDAIAVWWSADVDVALLALTGDEALTGDSLGGLLWADLEEGDPVEVTAVGFPDADIEAGRRESRQIFGRVLALSGRKAGRWVINAQGSIGVVPAGSASAWAGMSGAAVFAGDDLIGAIEIDPDPERPERLELWALPARMFANDAELAAWLRWDGGEDAWGAAPTPPVGALGVLRRLAEANEHVRVLPQEVLCKVREALLAQRDAIDDQTTRRAVTKVLAMLHSKNVLYASLDNEIWEYVFASLREQRASVSDAYAELLTTGPRSVTTLVDAMLTAIREYLALHGATYDRHMREMPTNQSVAHWEREWPERDRAGIGLLALREVLVGAVEPLNAFAAPDNELHLDSTAPVRVWEISQPRSWDRPGRKTSTPRESLSDGVRGRWGSEAYLDREDHDRELQRLTCALVSEVESLRIEAIRQLATIDTADAVKTLASALYADDPAVSAAALAALRGMHLHPDQVGTLIVEPVTNGLRDPQARARAVDALGDLVEMDLPSDLVATLIVEPLTEALSDEDERVRARAVRAASRFAGVAALPINRLIDALAHPDDETRRTAAHVLGELKARDAVTALSHSLLDKDVFVRSAAAYALAQIGDPESMAVLEHTLAEADKPDSYDFVSLYESTGYHVASALVKMGTDEAFAILAAAARRDPGDPDVMQAIADARDPRAVPALEVIAAQPDVPAELQGLHERVKRALRDLKPGSAQ